MAVPATEKAYEKHAWALLFALGIATVIFSITGLANYATWTSLVRSPDVFPDPVEFGAASAGWGIFFMALARTSYRKGERWA